MNKLVSIFVLAAAISSATSQLFRSRALNQNQRYPVPWSNYPRSEPLTASEPIRSTLRPLTDHDEPYSGTPNFVERPGGHQFVIVWDRVTSQRFWIPRKQFYAAFKGILNQVDPAADRVYPIVRNDNWGASATSRPINVPHQQRPFSAPTSDEVSVRTRVHNRPPKDDEEYETAASTNLEYSSRSLYGRGLNGYETFQPKIQPVYHHPAGVIPMWFDHAPEDNFRAAHLRRPLPIRRYHSAGYQGYQRRVSENTPIPPCNIQGSQYLHQCRDTLLQYMSKNVMKNERLDAATRRPLYQNLYKTETVEMTSSKGDEMQSTTEAVQPQVTSTTSTTEAIQAMEEQRTTEQVQAETTVVPVAESEVETVPSYMAQKSDSVNNDVNLKATTFAPAQILQETV